MQFDVMTRDYSRKNANGNKEIVKAVAFVSLAVASHPAGRERKEEAEALEERASHVMAEIAASLGLSYDSFSDLLKTLKESANIGLMTATQEEAYLASLVMLAKAGKLREVKLSGSALNLALQGVGPNARFITNALRKSVRGYLLLDNLED